MLKINQNKLFTMKFKKYYNIKLNKFKIILYIYIMSKKPKPNSKTRDDNFRSLLKEYKNSVFVVN